MAHSGRNDGDTGRGESNEQIIVVFFLICLSNCEVKRKNIALPPCSASPNGIESGQVKKAALLALT
jgi:hypothetical protein